MALLGRFGTAIPDNGQKYPLISSRIIGENILTLLNRQNDQGEIKQWQNKIAADGTKFKGKGFTIWNKQLPALI